MEHRLTQKPNRGALKGLPSPWCLLVLLALTTGLPAQDAESRLERLELSVRKLNATVDQLARDKGAQAERLVELEARLAAPSEADLEVLVERVSSRLSSFEPESGERAIQIGGYFDLEFRDNKAGDAVSEFDQHRLIIKIQAAISEGISFETEIEIEGGGAEAGFLTDNEIVVEYAELSFDFDEAVNLKVGALLVPFGRYNLLHDSPLQDLTDRPLVVRRIIPTTWTDAGVGLFGAVHPTVWLSIDYDVMIGNGLTDGMSSSGGMRGAPGSFREDNNDNKMIIGRIGTTVGLEFLDALNVGFSFAHGKYDDDGRRSISMIGFDWTAKKGPWELVGEWVQARMTRGTAERAAGIPGGMEGYYGELRFHFFPDSWRGTSPMFTEESTFTLVFRYGTADTDTGGTAVDFASRGDRYRDDRHRMTFGFNFRPVERTVLKFEYQVILEPGGIPDVDNNRFVASFATYF